MADPLQFAQQLAHQTSAATNQYRAQGADIGGPIAQGLQTGIGIGMNFEEFELKQAMAEAQVQENQISMQNLAQETGISIGTEPLRNVPERNGYVCGRPKHDLKPLQDAGAKQTAEELLASLKKRPKLAKSNYSLWMKQP